MLLNRVRVRRKWVVAKDVTAFELAPLRGCTLPDFTPGAHLNIRISAPGAPPLVRQYSLCNAPDETGVYVIGVKREPASRGGSAAMHDRICEGAELEMSEPINHFPLLPNASSHLLLGAGIGVTPLLAMAQWLEANAASYVMHYFARSVEYVAFAERLERGEHAGRVHYHLGLAPEETEERLNALLAAPPAGCHAYACGPAPFMDAVRRVGEPRWGAERLHFEHFQVGPINTAGDTPFEVQLARSGASCIVAAGQTIVQALARLGRPVETSCEQGICGTCLTRVLAGEPEHRDLYLSDAERARGDQMLVCVSRAHSKTLVLDL